jgi:hypothetical protein
MWVGETWPCVTYCGVDFKYLQQSNNLNNIGSEGANILAWFLEGNVILMGDEGVFQITF